MNIVADTGSIRGGIISPVDLATLSLPEGHFENIGNEMRFDTMVFAKCHTGTRRVKIPERDKFQAIDLLKPAEYFLEHQLGLSIGIYRTLRQVFRHGDALWGTIRRAGRTKHELFHATFHRGIEELQAINDIIVKIFL